MSDRERIAQLEAENLAIKAENLAIKETLAESYVAFKNLTLDMIALRRVAETRFKAAEMVLAAGLTRSENQKLAQAEKSEAHCCEMWRAARKSGMSAKELHPIYEQWAREAGIKQPWRLENFTNMTSGGK